MKMRILQLVSLIAFLGMADFANAQYLPNTPGILGDGDNPYIDTEYTYSVTADGGASEWLVYMDDSMGTSADPSAYSITGENTAEAKITWHTPGVYYLTYKEELNGCYTYRGIVVDVTANTFFLEMQGDKENCNAKEGTVLDWNIYATQPVETTLTFAVDVNKESGFNFNNWEFKGTYALPAGVVIEAGKVTASAGTVTQDVASDSFTVTGISEAVSSVTITMIVKGVITAGGDVTLNVSEGKANTVNGSVITVVSDNGSGDKDQVVKLKKLPGTSNINF